MHNPSLNRTLHDKAVQRRLDLREEQIYLPPEELPQLNYTGI
jgi:hypothetical protein